MGYFDAGNGDYFSGEDSDPYRFSEPMNVYERDGDNADYMEGGKYCCCCCSGECSDYSGDADREESDDES